MSNNKREQLYQEVERAANHYYHTPQQTGIDNRTRKFLIERCLPYLIGPNILELGYIDGLWTDTLIQVAGTVHIVEGASDHVAHAKTRYGHLPGVQIFHSLFQEFSPPQQYNTIVAGDMIRYLDDPLEFLQNIRIWMYPDSCLIVTVPNNRSLHRRVGALMNLQTTPQAANQRDQEVGNQRGYDRYELRHLLQQSGFLVTDLHGCFLKPLSSSQMENWSDELLRAFFLLGDELEDYCWFLYAVCRLP